MKKKLFISLLFLLLCGCLVKKKENNLIDNINFSDELTFEEFNYKLEVYSKISNYPDINE
jgi:hypothetical protein|tara:strand:- start:81 stop:260 length:180 start_codon:yes stop_codon:yes gene_type:complete